MMILWIYGTIVIRLFATAHGQNSENVPPVNILNTVKAMECICVTKMEIYFFATLTG
jgi:hypothetical protein